VKGWLAPAPLGKTLVTTRSREYGAFGTAVRVGVLTPPEASDLICSRRSPAGPIEHAAARGTDPARPFALMLRLYAPTKALFDKTWKLQDVEKL
jgi:hypothetical protein